MRKVWQKVHSWALWRFAIEQTVIAGLRVRASVPFSEVPEKEYIATVREALVLLEQHDPATLSHARRLLEGIHIAQFETDGATANYNKHTRLVTLNPVYLVGEWKYPVCTAMVLAHEIMHARVREAGIGNHHDRVERLCSQQSLVTGRRCGAPASLIEWARKEQAYVGVVDRSALKARRMYEDLESAKLSRFSKWLMSRRIRRLEAQVQGESLKGAASHGL